MLAQITIKIILKQKKDGKQQEMSQYFLFSMK